MIKVKELPYELQEFAEVLGENTPSILTKIEGWFEDTYQGVPYLAFVEAEFGLTHCCCLATGYKDQMEGFAEWVNKHSMEVEVEMDYVNPTWKGTPDKERVILVNVVGSSEWAAYIKHIVFPGYEIVSVNGKSTGFKIKDNILTLS